MRLQDRMIDVIEAAREAVFRYAFAVPEDRLEWKPLGAGQSVLRMARELAKTPDWAFWVLTNANPESPDDASAQQKAEMESWKTIPDCDAACQEKLVRVFDLYRSYSDEDLQRTKWLPFNGGRDHTYAELLDYPRWNFTYHLGQIAYIQTLFGDRGIY
ncbi:MAG: hypothetical protein EOP84_25810 [Verrucomicrobiaceae bacterium]|nr:MAG: hypothetical protein EOP84_25810 [Verrucomicrobiaceae bacterium]